MSVFKLLTRRVLTKKKKKKEVAQLLSYRSLGMEFKGMVGKGAWRRNGIKARFVLI